MSTFVVGVTVVAVVVVVVLFTTGTNAHLSPYRCALCVCCHFLDACLHVVCFFCFLFFLYLHVATAKVGMCVCRGGGGRGGQRSIARKLSEVVC